MSRELIVLNLISCSYAQLLGGGGGDDGTIGIGQTEEEECLTQT